MRKSLLFTSLLMTMSPSVLATNVFKNWTQTERSYYLDESKGSCIAYTTRRHRDTLVVAFPKDRKSLPLIAIRNKREIKSNYLGSSINVKGQQMYAFPYLLDGRNQSFFFIPKSAQQLRTLIQEMKDRGSMKARKWLVHQGSIRAHEPTYSLAGSTAALNALQRCLGGGPLVTKSQELLIETIHKYAREARTDSRTTSVQSLNAKAPSMAKALRQMTVNAEELIPFEDRLTELESNPRYQELKKQYDHNMAIITKSQSILDQIASDEEFYQNADQIIADLTGKRDSLETQVTTLGESKGAVDQRIATAEVEITRLNGIISLAQQETSGARTALSTERSNLWSVNESINRLERRIQQNRTTISNGNTRRPILRNNLQTAQSRLNNVEQLRREARQNVINRHGGVGPKRLKNQIAKLEEKITPKEERLVRLRERREPISSVIENAKKLKEQQPKLAAKRKQVKCIKEAADKETLLGCFKRPGRQLRRIDDLEKLRERALKKPQQSVQKLKTQVDSLVNRINNQIATVQAGNNLPAVQELKSCTAKPKKACLAKARAARQEINGKIDQVKNNIRPLKEQQNDLKRRLSRIENALDAEVRGMRERLERDVVTARQALINLNANIANAQSNLSQNIASRDSLFVQLSQIESSIARLTAALDDAMARQSNAESQLANFKVSVGYNGMVAESQRLSTELSRTRTQLANTKSSLAANIKRKERVASEIHTYPEKAEAARLSMEEAQSIVDTISQEYLDLKSVVDEARRDYNGVLRTVKPAALTFQRHFKTVKLNLP